jgi:hypothetical protein
MKTLVVKEKMNLGSFCHIICSDIIQIENVSYKNYLDADSKKSLSKNEYEAFNTQLPYYRILLLLSGILQKSYDNKIAYDRSTIASDFANALILAYEDNNYSQEEALKCINHFVSFSEKFFDYIIEIGEEEFRNKDLMFHASMFFSREFNSFTDKNTDTEKLTTFAALTNNNLKIIKEYFETAFNSVDIV